MHKVKEYGACRLVHAGPAITVAYPLKPPVGRPMHVVPGIYRESRCILRARLGLSRARQIPLFAPCVYTQVLLVLFESPRQVGPVPWAPRWPHATAALSRNNTATMGDRRSERFHRDNTIPCSLAAATKQRSFLVEQLLRAPYLDF